MLLVWVCLILSGGFALRLGGLILVLGGLGSCLRGGFGVSAVSGLMLVVI